MSLLDKLIYKANLLLNNTMKLHETSFLYAIIRFVSIAALFYFLKKPSRNKKDFLFSEFLLINLSKYAAISIIFIFILTLFKAYNLFNYLGLVVLFLIFDVNSFNPPKVILKSLKESLEKNIIETTSFIETSNKGKLIIQYLSSKKLNSKELQDFIEVLLIIILSLSIRMYFYSNDLFLFSEAWFIDFEKIAQILNQQWFSVDYTEMGEYALISLFSLFFKVSSGMSLQMFGVLQNIMLSILIYWIVKKTCTQKRNIIPLGTAIVFLGGFTITPIDITFIFKHRKVFSVLFIVLPSLLTLSRIQYFFPYKKTLITLSIALFSTALLSYSMLFLLVFPTIVFIIVFDVSKSIRQKGILMILFALVSLAVLFLFYYSFNYGQFNFIFFIKNSFIEVSNFSKIKNLFFPYDTVIKVTSILATLTLLINILTTRINIISVILCSLYLVTSAIYQTEHYLIDTNLSLLLFSFLTPVTLGIFMVDVVFNRIQWLAGKAFKYTSHILFVAILFTLILIQKDALNNLKRSNETNRQILASYDQIITNHLPYSYAVVNHQKAIPFSKKHHYFISYKEFSKTYLTKDSIFHNNKREKDFLKNNPHTILPNSIFLFEILNADKNVSRIGLLTPQKQLYYNDSIIKNLQLRNRKVILYKNTNRLRIYKIINKENSSNINNMLLYNNQL